MIPPINSERLWRQMEELSRLTEPERPYTRRSFSSLHQRGREWLQHEFEQAGLKTWIDAGGNLTGRMEGTRPDLAPIVTGSHSDTVDGGGRFDGIAGVLSALEAVQVLAEGGHTLQHPLEVIDFLAEEPSEYGQSCIGSRAISGDLKAEELSLTAPDGSTLAQGIARMGGNPAQLTQPLMSRGDIAGFFELHIEQGPVLESSGTEIGIVTNIVGITRMQLVFTGQADHAGTTPMEFRRDALLGAAETILWANELARRRSSEAPYLVATVGKMAVEPNNSNVVPGRVEISVEARSSIDQEVFQYLDAVRDHAGQIASQRRLALTSKMASHSSPAACSITVQEVIRQACEQLDLSYRFMASGAGHDAREMTKLGPAGMLFIPCKAGRSHCPEEWVDKDNLAMGATALLAALHLYDQKEEILDEHLG